MHKFLLLLGFAVSSVCCAQTKQSIDVGAAVPELVFPHVLRYHQRSVTVSQLNDLPLLLCSWNTNCSVVRGFAYTLDSLYRKHEGKFRVLLVTPGTGTQVAGALDYFEELRDLSLPIAVGDSSFRFYFPHQAPPLLVWIEKGGRIAAMTAHTVFNEGQLIRFIQGEQLNLPRRIDVNTKPYDNLPSLMEGLFGATAKGVWRYSYVGTRIPGVGSRAEFGVMDSLSREIRFRVVNVNQFRLYTSAYEEFDGMHPALFLVEKKQDVFGDSLFCYEQIVKDASRTEAFALMRKNLDAFFGVKSAKERKLMKVLALVRSKPSGKFVAAATSRPQNYVRHGQMMIRALPAGTVVRSWNRAQRLPFFVVDETGYKGKMDIAVPEDFSDLSVVRSALQRFDLDLQLVERWVEVLVLR